MDLRRTTLMIAALLTQALRDVTKDLINLTIQVVVYKVEVFKSRHTTELSRQCSFKAVVRDIYVDCRNRMCPRKAKK
jgi:hypothetical protein